MKLKSDKRRPGVSGTASASSIRPFALFEGTLIPKGKDIPPMTSIFMKVFGRSGAPVFLDIGLSGPTISELYRSADTRHRRHLQEFIAHFTDVTYLRADIIITGEYDD